MKKALCFLLLICTVFSLAACRKTEPKEISCYDIVKTYEEAGYYASHSAHQDEDLPYVCSIAIRKEQDDTDGDHIYFTTYRTEEEAKKAAKTDKYNIVIWIYALPFGEYRWLKSKYYGNISYSYYNSDLVEPFNRLIR